MKWIRIFGYMLWLVTVLGLVLAVFRSGSAGVKAVLLLLAILMTVYLAGMELLLYRPLREAGARLDGSEKEESLETLFSRGVPRGSCLGQIEPVVEKYVELKIRRNNAETFNKQTELTALQSQINPHFLYNTLDTIRGQAMCDDNLEVAKMIETLASFFRYSISRKGNMVTLRDELNNINNYMRIQQYRFKNRFTLEIVVDDEDRVAYDYYVPRLILQPIVENAIVHGLEEKTKGGQIVIEVTVTEDLIITVSDNGRGMSLKELDDLNQRIHSKKTSLEEEDMRHSQSTGIALPNINKRIELLYGKKYGLNVYSSIGCGTDVEIVIPANNHIEELAVEKNNIENQ